MKTNEEILKRAIEKAEKNGYKFIPGCLNHDWIGEYLGVPVSGFIFSHDFAKAFWGEEKYGLWIDGEFMDDELTKERAEKHTENWEEYKPMWQYHLQQMVLEEDPIKYLERFI